MESSAKIRRLVLVEGRSIRSISRETGLSRNTIKKYVSDPSPPCYRRANPPVRHKLQGFEDDLRSMWEMDQQRPCRERRTALKLYEQLVGKGSYSPVCRYVKQLRETGSYLSAAFIPLSFKAGDCVRRCKISPR